MADIRESITFGLDLGIGSCGWAVEEPGGEGVIAAGAWVFDVPETDKERTPKNQLRRGFRGLRRVIHRRAERMGKIRALFAERGLLTSAEHDALWIKDADARLLDPWRIRAAGLDRMLSGPELAVALGHLAKHRGFKSNSKRDHGANAPKEGKALLAGVATLHEATAKYRTVGETLAKDAAYVARKRNRENDYARTPLRQDHEHEVKLLFERQRSLGNAHATPSLEEAFAELAFSQRPLQDSEAKVGRCPFEPAEQRAARRSYSFELFRLLSRLATLRLSSGREERPLTADEVKTASANFGTQKKLSFNWLRGQLQLGGSERFVGVPPDEEKKRDFVARSGAAAEGTYTLRQCVGDAVWNSLLKVPDKLDRIAFVLSFRDDVDRIRDGLAAIGLDPLILDAIMRGVSEGNFAAFKGAGHISAKAARNLIPHLLQGEVYSDACVAAGYPDHTQTASAFGLLPRPASRQDIQAAIEDSIGSPVARKALIESLKQFEALVHAYGLPGHVHVELARDVGKGADERAQIDRGIQRRTEEKEKRRAEFEDVVGHRPIPGTDDLLRYELWKEQEGRSLYSDATIDPRWLVSTDNRVQVDHILPWSRFGDDSFINLTLCLVTENQDKGGETPYEWFGRDEARWAEFSARVERLKAVKGRKKRNLLLKDAKAVEEKFRNRNLNDTRYAARLLLEALTYFYPDDGYRRTRARPGPLTDKLRQAWGVQDLKKRSGQRVPDQRHHALDALVVAATSEAMLQQLTRAHQAAEKLGAARPFTHVPEPWQGFIGQVKTQFHQVFVARGERRRARGEGHGATIRQVVDGEDRPQVYERAAVDDLSISDLALIKDAERNAKLVESIRIWIETGKPKDNYPLSPKGDAIRKVRLLTKKKPDVLVRGGAADRGEMARVDVFNKGGKFYLVPIYPHQIFDKERNPAPPSRAVQAYKPEEQWPAIDATFEFLFSLSPFAYVEVVRSDGEVVDGYFRGLHRTTGAITISAHNRPDDLISGIGARTLKYFRKFSVDRLGQRHEIERETRTWHGVACT